MGMYALAVFGSGNDDGVNDFLEILWKKHPFEITERFVHDEHFRSGFYGYIETSKPLGFAEIDALSKQCVKPVQFGFTELRLTS